MKRLLIRLSALVGVVTVGTVAIVQAQRSLSSAEAQEERAPAEPVAANGKEQAKSPNGLPAEKKPAAAPKRLPVADPFAARAKPARYADRYADHDPNSSASPSPDEPDAGGHAERQAALGGDGFPDASQVAGLNAAEASAPKPLRNPFAGPAGRGAAASEPAPGDRDAGVQLVAANEVADRYAPGSVGGEPTTPAPAKAKSAKKKPAKQQLAADPPTDRYAVDGMGAERPTNNLRATEESEPAAEELPPVDALRDATSESTPESPPERTRAGGLADYRQRDAGQTMLAAEQALPGGDFDGDEGSGKPGGKHLEGPQTPTLTLEKIAPKEIQVGKPAVFEVRVRNAGQVVAQGVEIYEQVPHGTRLIAADPPASQADGGEVVWAIGALRPGEEAKVSLEVMPQEEGEIGSVATVHFASEASARTICTRPKLALEVQAPREVLIGEEAKLSIKVTNPGTGTASGVVLSESVPETFSHPAGPELEYEIGDLKPGETRKLELSLKATQGGDAVNRLAARADAQLTADQETELTVVAPRLEVALQGPKRRFLERRATYTMLVSNPGTAPAKEVKLVAHLPDGLDFVEANNAGQYDPKTKSVHWLLEELPANETGQVTLTTLPVEPGEQLIELEGTADRGLAAKRQETIQIEGVAAILFQVIDAADPIEVGGETTYEIRVVNQGSKVATNIQLRADLPHELKPLDAQGPTRFAIDGWTVAFEPLARLAPKADTTFRLTVQGLQPGDLRVQIQLKTDEMETPVTKEESTRVYADE